MDQCFWALKDITHSLVEEPVAQSWAHDPNVLNSIPESHLLVIKQISYKATIFSDQQGLKSRSMIRVQRGLEADILAP